jgi:hypothetical protein
MLVGGVSHCLVLKLLKSFGHETDALHEIIVVADTHTPQDVIYTLSAFPKVVLEPLTFRRSAMLVRGAQVATSFYFSTTTCWRRARAG